MTRSIRIGVFGTGAMARTMIAAIAGVEGVEVAGVASRNESRAAEVATSSGITAFRDFDALLAAPGIDAIYIASEPVLHSDLACRALSAGKPVLCEKPCAVDPEGAARIADRAAAMGGLFMEGIATPFLPAVARALETARAEGLGAPRLFAASFGYPITRTSHPVCFAADGGGVLLDRAIYLVTLSRLIFGPIRTVEGVIRRDADGIDTHAAIMLEHEDGTAQLAASFDALLGNDATIGCERGAIRLATPLLACERLRIGEADPPEQRAAQASIGFTQRLKGSAFLRRARAVAGDMGGAFLPYGASPYEGELAHFRDLVRTGAKASPVLPPALTLEVHRTLALLRRGS